MLMSVTSSRWGLGLSNNHVTFMSVHNACGRAARGAEAGESREESLEAAWAWPGLLSPGLHTPQSSSGLTQ